jgi:hypothetical protein
LGIPLCSTASTIFLRRSSLRKRSSPHDVGQPSCVARRSSRGSGPTLCLYTTIRGQEPEGPRLFLRSGLPKKTSGCGKAPRVKEALRYYSFALHKVAQPLSCVGRNASRAISPGHLGCAAPRLHPLEDDVCVWIPFALASALGWCWHYLPTVRLGRTLRQACCRAHSLAELNCLDFHSYCGPLCRLLLMEGSYPFNAPLSLVPSGLRGQRRGLSRTPLFWGISYAFQALDVERSLSAEAPSVCRSPAILCPTSRRSRVLEEYQNASLIFHRLSVATRVLPHVQCSQDGKQGIDIGHCGVGACRRYGGSYHLRAAHAPKHASIGPR